ncbi:MAG: dihydrofolate reductase [Patescibacteria group bacterium]
MILSIISAIGKNNELGKKNDLLWNLPADMKHFRETTRGHTVVMGQKTFESLGRDENGNQIGRLLSNRRNIILTQDTNFKKEGAEIAYSIEELMNLLKNTTLGHSTTTLGHSPMGEPGEAKIDEEVFIIGGGQIYKLFINKADKLYITHVDESFPDAEIFFPIIEESKWQKIKSEKYLKDDLNKYDLEFTEYTRK